MKIHEYQAKQILAQAGIPVPAGGVASTPEEARQWAQKSGKKVAVKAQVYAGGRGKAGGIKVAENPEQAASAAASLIGKRLVTHQTTAAGVPVDRVLVEEVIDISRELYLSIVIDSSSRMPVIIASAAGGMDIEEIARTAPEKILKATIDPATGYQQYHGRMLAYGMKLDAALVRDMVDIIGKLYKVFKTYDCSLAEINPLVVTKDNKIVALDAKLNFDDNALFRHQDIARLHDLQQEDMLEVQAHNFGVKNYVKMDGGIGCMVNGAGLAMSVLDLLTFTGGKPANFLDIGTLNTTDRVVNAFKVFKADPDVKAVFINIFGGMARVDVIARGIIEAHQQMDVNLPIVVRLAGTNVEEGKKILAESSLKLIYAATLQDAAEKAVMAARGALK